MEKLAIALMLLYTILSMTKVCGTIKVHNEAFNQWISSANEKVSHLHFYAQVVSSGPNKTEVLSAQGSSSDKSPTLFGTIMVIDDHITEGPEPTSKRVGRAEGIASFSGQDEVVFLLVVNFIFTSGDFRGSSLTMVGRNNPVLPIREMPIVGGTGVFRLARGFASSKTSHFDVAASNGIYEYNVVVIHY